MTITPWVKLNNGVEMPNVGIGMFQITDGENVGKAVEMAIRNGYRKIDTAYVYHNEEGVGNGIKNSGIPRQELFITSKIGNNQQGYESAKSALKNSLAALHTDYLDLYIIHWPQGKKSIETWKAMEEMYEEGLVRSIGVSNFQIHHLEYLLNNCRIVPAVNQVEFHPLYHDQELYEYCRSKNIQLIAWSPLMKGKVLKNQLIRSIAKKYNKTPAQVTLRWTTQKGVVPIPKSETIKRIVENINIFDFSLSNDDMNRIDSLNQEHSLIQRTERIKFLLQMFFNQKFDKKLFSLLSKEIKNRVITMLHHSKPA